MFIDPLIDFNLLLTLSSVAFIAGLIDAIAGGGGMLTVPVLLTTGLPPHIALGTNKLAASFGSGTASFTFYKKQLFKPHFWKISLYFTAIGAIAGTVIVNFIAVEFLEKFIPILIIFTAIYTLFSKSNTAEHIGLPKYSGLIKIKQAIQGSILGFYDGVAGPGTGAFWVSSSSYIYKINLLLSSGLARCNNFISNFCSLLTFIYLGQVNYIIGFTMGVFMMIGAWVGAHWAIKFGSKFIKPVFTFVVIIMSVKLGLAAWLN